MLKKLFRADLNLNKYWWHRLFKVLVLLLVGYILYTGYYDFLDESKNHYGRVADLEDRLTDEVSEIDDLLQIRERFTDFNWQGEEEYFRENIFCSKRLSDTDNIEFIIEQTGINNFNRLKKNENSIDIESFSMLLRSTNVKCIIADNAEIDFLNPMRQFDDFGFYKPDRIQYLKDSLFIQKFLLNFGLIMLLVYLLYYRLFLYIVFGKNKS